MPNDNDNRLANTPMESELFHRLKGFNAYPSEDGMKLYSMTVPEGAPPVFIEASRSQVTASLQEINMAAWLMAQRSGTAPDPLIEAAAILTPRLDCCSVRYSSSTQHVNWAFCFHHRLPLALSMSFEDWQRLKRRTDAVIRFTTPSLAALMTIS